MSVPRIYAPMHPNLKQLGITIIDTTDIRAGDPLAHNTFADNPEMVQLLGQRLSGQSLNTGDDLLADRVGVTALGTMRIVGSTAGAAVDGARRHRQSCRTPAALPAVPTGWHFVFPDC